MPWVCSSFLEMWGEIYSRPILRNKIKYLFFGKWDANALFLFSCLFSEEVAPACLVYRSQVILPYEFMKKFHEPTFLRDYYYGAECADTLSMSISLVEWPLPVVGVTRVNGVRGNYLLIDSRLCNKMSCH